MDEESSQRRPRKPSVKQAGEPAAAPVASVPDRPLASCSLKLNGLARAGVSTVEVHFRGCDDDGNFEYRVRDGERELQPEEQKEIEKFLAKYYSFYGECEGSVLIGRLDLKNCVWTGYSGGGGPSERLAELMSDLEARGVGTLVADVRAGKCSKVAVNPEDAMSVSDARGSVEWFLERIHNYFIEAEEYVPEGAEAVAAIHQHAWGECHVTLNIDAQGHTLSLSGPGIPTPIEAFVNLAAEQKAFNLID